MSVAIVAICNLVWNVFLFGGCAYIVFWRGSSPWWFLLACLIEGGQTVIREKKSTKKD